jgi:hypothetical protein
MAFPTLQRITPPPTELFKELYSLTVNILGARIQKHQIGQFRSLLPKHLLVSIPRIKAVIEDPEGSEDHRGFLFNPTLFKQREDLENDSDVTPLLKGILAGHL